MKNVAGTPIIVMLFQYFETLCTPLPPIQLCLIFVIPFFRIFVTFKVDPDDASGFPLIKHGKISFVDLAGE